MQPLKEKLLEKELNFMDKFKAEILQQWCDKGKDDLRSAEYLSTMHHPTPDEIICFLCQQSAEKYLKAFIFSHDIEPEKTHDLRELLKVCEENDPNFSSLLSKLQILTRYGVMPRYPNDLEITSDDMKTAIQYARDVQEFVLQVLKEENTSEE